MRLQQVMLFVKDLPAMVAFYAEVLGTEPIVATLTDDWAEFDLDGAVLALHAIPFETASQLEVTTPPQPREDTPYKLAFLTDDLPELEQRIVALGGVVVPRPWGTSDYLDLEGNVFAVTPSPPVESL